ncbi:MBL fold metallo-hydrolase [uncultured Paracoccus sp.]|uniref:MBL fold metallo-hydrolase n=1 Tax=uncultured Paracoccus sp. TaxID=189685 RepID=UPI0026173DDF|nr:MBL fold metallo-hydrolase [uncultured Paracoccus sp.]
MKITRRFVLAAAPATLALAALPLTARRGWAVTTLVLGDLRIDSVSDGWMELPADFTTAGIPEDSRDEVIAQFDLPTEGMVESPLNVTLLRQGDRVVLFDVGSGPDFMPTAGKLTEALDAVGIAPEDVTDVVFTHAHPDHLWGVLDEFDEPLFANAAMQMGRAEHEYWSDPQILDTIREDLQSFAAGASRRIEVLGDSLTLFEDGAEVIPGVTAVATPGHTPGHMSFAIGTPEQGVFVTGDFVTTLLGFARPDIGAGTDSDPELAAQTRAAMLARLAEEKWPIIGYHLPDGGIGRVEADGEAYKFVAEG